MISGACKVLSVAIIGYCAADSLKSAEKVVDSMAALPKRVMTTFELKQIHRLIRYELVGSSSASIRMDEFCRSNLSASGRDPGQDYWQTPYRLYMNGRLHHEGSGVSISEYDADKYVVVSAAQDKAFMSEDDLTSEGNTDADVQELRKQIDAEVKKVEEKEKKSKEKSGGGS
ncbi:MAG: hypothetical protein A3G34_02975 [Candidatus Lindowbacteria bacterium RIFCSPLOWO2_12_FULL_62_27]|nr:MAG: hypothetical protein A3G34_02975 [Candidatus Lindowbacteria bacterium RIFCSPLOWO2_12_FULL_62_27]OGH61675.1 MAG: hypothetical protein A3I06_01690 [Candidatus Lindowbacteria bacterium RIFCSPLOWO2_02_FULL_62_12]